MSLRHPPQMTKTGFLPHLSLILRKPEPLGAELQVIACPQLGMGLGLEAQEGRDPMRSASPQRLGSAAACVHRLVEMMKGHDEDGNNERCLALGNSWFGSHDCIMSLKRSLGQACSGKLHFTPLRLSSNTPSSFVAGGYSCSQGGPLQGSKEGFGRGDETLASWLSGCSHDHWQGRQQ